MSYIDREGQPVDMTFEKYERELVKSYVPKDATVLEMGARYGTVSCVISQVLDNPKKHVAVEPDVSVIDALMKNRFNNGGMFQVYNGVVSTHGYDIHTVFTGDEYGTYTKKSDRPTVPHMSIQDLESTYNMKFDCIVADCEGFFCDFVDENPDCIKNMRVIIYEQDGTPWSEMEHKYKKLDDTLTSFGFTLVHTFPHPLHANNPRLHNAWVKVTHIP